MPDGIRISERLQGKLDWIQIFVKNTAEPEKILPTAAEALNPDPVLWIALARRTSKIQTDLTRGMGWEGVARWIPLVSINNIWSAFSLRPYRPGEARQAFHSVGRPAAFVA